MLIVTTPVSQQNHIKRKVFWQVYFTVILDVVISRRIQNIIPKKYWWNLHFTSDIWAELSNPHVLLSDMVINYSLLLLNKQFGDAHGLEDTELGTHKQFSKQNMECFWILNYLNHWLVIAKVAECADKVVYLYDSLSPGYTSKNVVKQICHIKFCQVKKLHFCKRSAQQQSNGVDCGAFAVAFATDLLFGFSPEKRNYDESKLRNHLPMCLEQGKLVPLL